MRSERLEAMRDAMKFKSPHRALLEMYRVARKCVIAFESRDSLLIRTAVRFGLMLDYELNAIAGGRGGLADTAPQFRLPLDGARGSEGDWWL
jgi:hypothetical protein